MATIPLPALHVNPPQPTDPMEQYGRLMALRNMVQNAPLQRQALQQQVQAGQLENQTRQMDIQARQALQAASAGAMTQDASGNPTFDPDKFQKAIAGTPAFTPATIENLTKMQQARVALQGATADLQTKMNDMKGFAANAIKASNYNPAVAHGILDSFMAQNPQMANSPEGQQIRATIDNPDALKQWVDTTVAQSPAQQKMQNEKDVAGIRANNVEMQEMRDWLAKNPGKTPSDYQQFKVNQGVQASIDKETNPQVIRAKAQGAAAEAAARQPYQLALQRQEQALRQGDPNSAAQLLISGDATLNELKSRGATPDFIQKTLAAAHDLSGGKYNAQAADAQFDVAKSPQNVAFFGSAKSLTDKGGTLDQLAAAAKDIPQNQIPAFNSIADWERAATGNGPLAKYASLVLGVADDYSKVMGGGQGSDASRQQALNLIAAKQSPQQRAGSIEGIRGAVTSQMESRIGNNPVLKRMYGGDGSTGNNAAPAGTQAFTDNGVTYHIPTAMVDEFKKDHPNAR